MQKDLLKQASLWFSTVDEHGRWYEETKVRSLRERFTVETYLPKTYRVQALVTGFTPLEPVERDEARKFFEAARKLLAAQLLGQLKGK